MLTCKRKPSSFGQDGRRLKTCCPTTTRQLQYRPRVQTNKSTANLFSRSNNDALLLKIVERAPILCGLNVPSSKLYNTPFQRPMIKRRSYGTDADVALKKSTLGQKKRMDGMKNLLARAGKGLDYKMRRVEEEGGDSDDSDKSDEEEEEKEKEKPFEPLMVWKSPHNGGEALGLPARMCVYYITYNLLQYISIATLYSLDNYSFSFTSLLYPLCIMHYVF